MGELGRRVAGVGIDEGPVLFDNFFDWDGGGEGDGLLFLVRNREGWCVSRGRGAKWENGKRGTVGFFAVSFVGLMGWS